MLAGLVAESAGGDHRGELVGGAVEGDHAVDEIVSLGNDAGQGWFVGGDRVNAHCPLDRVLQTEGGAGRFVVILDHTVLVHRDNAIGDGIENCLHARVDGINDIETALVFVGEEFQFGMDHRVLDGKSGKSGNVENNVHSGGEEQTPGIVVLTVHPEKADDSDAFVAADEREADVPLF